MPHYVASASTLAVSASILLVWLSGVVVAICGMMQAQRRYWVRLRGASDVTDANARWPVLLASHTCIGPAMVGAWRVRIVLPSDFNERYDAIERALILAHESTHARRRDGLCCLLAQIVCVIFWFHPLAWLALAAFRLDQELACDAVVMREHGARRRCYANALLKTQNADLALPVGCLWSPRHPLTERIAMLNLKTPSRRRRISGACVLIFSLAGLSSAAYAVSQRNPVQHSGTKSAQAPGSEYQLDVYAQKTTAGASSHRVERATLALCSTPGKQDTFRVGDWKVGTTVSSDAHDGVQIGLAVLGAGDLPLAQSQAHGTVGHALHVDLKSPDGKDHYAFVVTPLNGCPARDANKTASN